MQRERRRAALSGRDGKDSLAAITKLAAATATTQHHPANNDLVLGRSKSGGRASATAVTPRCEGKAHSFRRPRADDAAERMARRLNAVRTRRKHVLDLFSVFQTEAEKQRAGD